MRKAHLKLLKEIEFFKFDEKLTEFLKSEEYTIKELKIAVNYFRGNKGIDSSLLIKEFEQGIKVIKDLNKEINNENFDCTDILLSPLGDFLVGKMPKKIMYAKALYNKVKGIADPFRLACVIWDYMKIRTKYGSYKFTRYLLDKNIFLFSEMVLYKDGVWELLDDFFQTKEKSILYYLAENGLLESFLHGYSTLSDFKVFYNSKTQSYDITIEEFNRIYSFAAIADGNIGVKTNEFEFIKFVCKANAVRNAVANYVFNESKFVYELDRYTIVEPFCNIDTESLIKISKETKEDIILKIPGKAIAYELIISFSKAGYINFNYYEKNELLIENDKCWYRGFTSKKSFFLTPDGSLFMNLTNGKKIPMPFSTFMKYYSNNNTRLSDLFACILDAKIAENKFYKDFYNDCMEIENKCLIPVSFNEIGEFHNKKEFILAKYKAAKDIRCNWNKKNLIVSYMIIKAYPLTLPGKSRQVLINTRNEDMVSYINFSSPARKLDDKKEKFFSSLLLDKTKSTYGVNYNTILDYVKMALLGKIKLKLDVKSVEEIKNLHDELALNCNNARTKRVSIPKNSKFNALRKLLPKEFEWIKSRRRLIKESEMQRHCVWSYADKISADNCAIYSINDTTGEYDKNNQPARYTIEFTIKKNKYVISQIQKKFDRGGSDLLSKYIYDCIKENNKMLGERIIYE